MRSRSDAKSARGSVLLVALMVVVLVAGLTVALMQIGLRFTSEQSRRLDDEEALMLDDSGHNESLVALRLGLSGSVASETLPARLGDGVLWSQAVPVGQSMVLVRAAGMCNSGRTALEQLVFHYSPQDLINFAVFANNDLRLHSNVLIDSFDPALGSYGDQLAASGLGHVDDTAVSGSNAAVLVDSSVEVWGDLHPGPGESVLVPNSSSVSGLLQPLPTTIDLPPVDVPDLPDSGVLQVDSGGVQLLPGDYEFDSLRVESGASLAVEGPTRLVIDDFELESNSTLTLDTSSGPIEIFVRGAAELRSNSSLVVTEPSANGCSIFFVGGPGQTAHLRSNTDFFGRVYSPEGVVEISANFEVFGNVIADRLVLSSHSQVHYDTSLSGSIGPGEESFVAFAWNPTGFPIAALIKDRRDPFLLLGVNAGSLPTPADAHVP